MSIKRGHMSRVVFCISTIFLPSNLTLLFIDPIQFISKGEGQCTKDMKVVFVMSLALAGSLAQSYSLLSGLENIFDDYSSFKNETGWFNLRKSIL